MVGVLSDIFLLRQLLFSLLVEAIIYLHGKKLSGREGPKRTVEDL